MPPPGGRAEWWVTSVLPRRGANSFRRAFQLPEGEALLCQAEPKEKSHDIVVTFFFGGPEGIRTHDLTDANRTLSQLSYVPTT